MFGRLLCGLLGLLGLCVSACGSSDEAASVPTPDLTVFTNNVYPVLLRDCAFSTCHGAEHRFFRVYGPGRTRLDPNTMPHDLATAQEVQLSYERACSMLATAKAVQDSLLLRKPLELSAGGQGHKGVDRYGRNVYRSQQDASYQAIRAWATSAPLALPAANGGGAGATP